MVSRLDIRAIGFPAVAACRAAPFGSVVFLTLEQAGYYAALSPRPHPWVAVPVGTSYLERDVRVAADEKLPSLITGPGSIWLVEYRGVLGPGQRTVETWVASHAFPAGSATLSDSVVLRFTTDATVGDEHPVFRHFADGVVLISGAFPSPIHPGQPLPIRLRWKAAHPLRRDLAVFIHLVDAAGQTVAQSDGPPVAGLAPTTRWQGLVVDRHGLIVPPNLRPGTYWIDVGLYDAAGRLEVVGRSDGVARLGPVEIGDGKGRMTTQSSGTPRLGRSNRA